MNGPAFGALLFVGTVTGLYAIKHLRKGDTVTCRECNATQVLRDGIKADEFRQYHRNLHEAERRGAEMRRRRANAERN